jgi:hypothetical protein
MPKKWNFGLFFIFWNIPDFFFFQKKNFFFSYSIFTKFFKKKIKIFYPLKKFSNKVEIDLIIIQEKFILIIRLF